MPESNRARRAGFRARASIEPGRKVSGEVHRVVEDPDDFDDLSRRGAIEDEMPSPAPVPRDVQRAQLRQDLVARDAAGGVRAGLERRESGKKRLPINAELSRAEFFFRVL